jgi:hypothetical protein
VVHRPVLVKPLHEHLPDKFDTGVHSPTAHIAENRRPLLARLDRCAGSVRPRRDADLGTERGLVGGKGIKRRLTTNDENAVVDVDTDKELRMSAGK